MDSCFCDKNNYKVFSIISTKFSGAAYVKFSDATFYTLLNVMDLGSLGGNGYGLQCAH
jgi:hypothetical protein